MENFVTRKEFTRKVASYLIPFVAAFFVRLFFFTCKKIYHFEGALPTRNCVFVGWHGELFFNPLLYRKVRKTFTAYALVSRHFDGELIARTNQLSAQIHALRGSSSKGGRSVLLQAIKQLKNGADVVLTPDGPRGPRHKLQGGVLSLAKRSGGKVVVITHRPQRFWRLKSWDQFMIAKPFTKVDVYFQSLQLQEFDEKELSYLQERMLVHAI